MVLCDVNIAGNVLWFALEAELVLIKLGVPVPSLRQRGVLERGGLERGVLEWGGGGRGRGIGGGGGRVCRGGGAAASSIYNF